jgi:hypothetical protein
LAVVAASGTSSTFDVDHTRDSGDCRDESKFDFNNQTGTAVWHWQ